MKCLEKDRARRYDTASSLASDLQRHLKNEPVVACPPSVAYRFQKMVRRNKVAFAATGAVGAALALGLATALWQFAQKAYAYKRAVTAEISARTEAAHSRQVAQFLKSMLQGLGPSVGVARDTALLGQILDKTAARTAEDLTNQPLVALELRSTIAATYGDLGLFVRMEELSRQNLELAQALLGGTNTAVADALYQIGEAEKYRRNLEEAERFAREALQMRKDLFGSEHPDVARSLLQLGGVLHLKGKNPRSVPAAGSVFLPDGAAVSGKLRVESREMNS